MTWQISAPSIIIDDILNLVNLADADTLIIWLMLPIVITSINS